MKNITIAINQILSDWDPLNVGENTSLDEYSKYVNHILRYINDKESLTIYLEKLLTYDLDTGYDPTSREQKNSVDLVVKKLNDLVSN
ncbi:hypothetical protein OC25_15280 [Pedobacter kyungheensis]|uniref:DUF1871 domain-containing protein n=1 Tax=Pedobacter kyungheensis TaxID=1069985 RepID=A0A0C1D6L8_9SPHI|nr:hypothetical protein [Pedobacter kyungheensis]KIA92756.1 hypothetical protein OC25_15280 [Pedobacter kyungheensis]